MRILIIGGTRFIGPPVATRLSGSGHAVTVFHRGESEGELPPGVEHVHGDRHRLADFQDEIRRVQPEVVLDMAPFTEVDAQEIMNAFRGIAGRIVAVSSQDVYRAYGRLHGSEAGPPEAGLLTEDAPLRETLYPYGGNSRGMDSYDKIPIERVVMGSPDFAGTILRLPMVYGERDYQRRLALELQRMDDGRPAILLGEKFAGWRWTRGYVDNVAAGIALAVTDPRAAGRIYNLGDPDALSYADWVRVMGRAAGWSGEVIVVPEGRLPPQLRPPAGDYAHDLAADTSRIRQELAYIEPVPFFQALLRTIDWERSHRPAGERAIDYAPEDALLEKLRSAQWPTAEAAPPSEAGL